MKIIYSIIFLIMISGKVMSQDQAVLEQIKTTVNSNHRIPDLKTDQNFDKTLSSIISVRWKNRQLRDGIFSLSNHYQISIILDRRINPNQFLNLNSIDTTLSDFLAKISKMSQASMTVLSDVVYIGPLKNSHSLRTIISKRENEISHLKNKSDLSRLFNIHWNDLDRPADIFKNLLNDSQIQVSHFDAIPHDLWMKGSIPRTTFAKAASILLIQYDLTYEWNQAGNQISLIPISYPVSIERSYKVSQKKLRTVIPELKKENQFPQFTIKGRTLSFSGSIEEHEAFENRLSGKKTKALHKTDEPISLDRRRFTLNLKAGSAKLLINLLKKNGIQINYNEKRFDSAGVDLDKKIEINLKRASIQELLESFCDPLKIQYRIEGNSILLTPL